MEDILKKIVAKKREEVADYDLQQLKTEAMMQSHKVISISKSVKQTKGGIIAEFKRRSPSKGWINRDAVASDVVGGYQSSGAAACSVLTDGTFFGGGIDDFILARSVATDIPLLRKEFIIDPRQIYQSRAIGADAILLIAAILTKEESCSFSKLAHSLGLEVLLEIHSSAELGYIDENIDMVGVNNRNLSTFDTSISNSYKLVEGIKERSGDIPIISESGIKKPESIVEMQGMGFNGFLIGESFMRSENPSAQLSQFIKEL